MPATEYEIRQAIHRDVVPRVAGEGDPVIPEFGLCNGAVRVDLAVINGSLHGYEIKSGRDTLERLPNQVEVYGRVLDYAAVVVARSHEAEATALVPSWWGVYVVREKTGCVGIFRRRKERRNPAVSAKDVARLLWRDELLSLLREVGAARKARELTHLQLAGRVADTLPLDEVRNRVRAALKARHTNGWRASSLARDEGNVMIRAGAYPHLGSTRSGEVIGTIKEKVISY